MIKVDTKKLSEISLIFIAIVIVIFLLKLFESFLRPLLLATILSFLFTPFLRMTRTDKIKQLSKIVLGGIVAVTIIALVSSSTLEGLQALSGSEGGASAPAFNVETLQLTLGSTTLTLTDFVDVEKIQSGVASVLSTLVGSITGFVSELFLIILFLIFIIPIHKLWLNNTTAALHKQIRSIILDMEKGVVGYIKAKAVISFGTAACSSVIFLILGIDNILLFAIMMFLFNFIPTFGDYISFAVIFVVQLFTIGFGLKLVILFVLLFIIQIIFANFIEPRYAGKSLELSPLIIMISLLFWGALWGVGGMLFSVPLTLAIKTLLKHSKVTQDVAKAIA